MVEIKQTDGTVVRRGRNLRVLRDAVRGHEVEHITLSRECVWCGYPAAGRRIEWHDRTDPENNGVAVGAWGDLNPQGHRTFNVTNGRALYLFEDEVDSDEPAADACPHSYRGTLHVLFARTRIYGDRLSGGACTVEFASYDVMRRFVARWKSVQHVPLTTPEREYATVVDARKELQS